MRQLIFYRGHPGSGKTTHAQRAVEYLKGLKVNVSHWETDQFFIKDGVYTYDRAFVATNHLKCQWAVENDMNHGVEVIIVSNTFIKLWEMEPYVKLAHKHKYDTISYRCQGDFENTHGAPDEVVERMKRNYEPHPGDILLGVSDHG